MSDYLDRGYRIRRAVAGDRARLTKLVRAYIDFYKEPQPDDDRLDTLLAALAERPEVGVQFVAREGRRTARLRDGVSDLRHLSPRAAWP